MAAVISVGDKRRQYASDGMSQLPDIAWITMHDSSDNNCFTSAALPIQLE
jgi:hypothetical protein